MVENTLEYRRISKPVYKDTFDCGVPDINTFVFESYAQDVAQAAYTYSINASGVELGYYQVFFQEVRLDYLPEELTEFMMPHEDSVTSIHIQYIALDKKYQGHDIGTFVINSIIKSIRILNNNWPVRIISIDALPYLVPWYESLGFIKMVKNKDGQKTDAMYFDCADAEAIQRELACLAESAS